MSSVNLNSTASVSYSSSSMVEMSQDALLRKMQEVIGYEIKPPLVPMNGSPYIACNETGQDLIIQELARKNFSGTGHLGFACWLNFDIIAATRPSFAILCDINETVIDFFKIFEKTIGASETRESFIASLQENCKSNQEIQMTLEQDNFLGRGLGEESNRKGGWLSTEEGFETVRNLYLHNKVFIRHLDITENPQFFEKGNGIFQTVYASNISEWVPRKEHLYQKNMKEVVSGSTYFIDAFYLDGKKDQSGPPLRITQGCLPSFDKVSPSRVYASRAARKGCIEQKEIWTS